MDIMNFDLKNYETLVENLYPQLRKKKIVRKFLDELIHEYALLSIHPSSGARLSHTSESLSSSASSASALSLASSQVSTPTLHFSASFWKSDETLLAPVNAALARCRVLLATAFSKLTSSDIKAMIPSLSPLSLLVHVVHSLHVIDNVLHLKHERELPYDRELM
ncbi:hypothetical protein ACFX11_010481 [Malus domestica]